MDDEQLRRLIGSLAILATNGGSFPLHTFSVLASAAPSDKLAEQLHQRWLADESFANIAAIALLHLHHMGEVGDTALWSCCMAHLIGDYRARYELRKRNAVLLRNSVRALLKMYPIFRQIDPVLSECLAAPMFVSLGMLLDDTADEKDIQTAASLLIEDGAMLHQLRAMECDQLVMRVRHCLCEASTIGEQGRRLLLKVIDLWTYGWDEELFPDCLVKFYETVKKTEQFEDEKDIAQRKINTPTTTTLSTTSGTPGTITTSSTTISATSGTSGTSATSGPPKKAKQGTSSNQESII